MSIWARAIVVIALSGVAATAAQTAAQSQPASSNLQAEFDQLLREGEQLRTQGAFDRARVLYEQALAHPVAVSQPAQELDVLTALADLEFFADRPMRAIELNDRAAVLAAAQGNRLLLGRARYLGGVIDRRIGKLDTARVGLEQAVADFTAIGDERRIALAQYELLNVSQGLAPQVVKERIAEAFRHAQASGNQPTMGTVLHGWGDDLFMFGEYEAAFEKYKQAIEMYQSPELAVRLGTVYNSIGRLYRRHNQLDVALDYQRRALKIHERTGRPASLMQSLNAVGVTLQSLGRDREARVYLERALEIARQAQNPRTQDFVAANLSSTLMAEGAYDAAATVLEGVIARKLDEYPAYRWRSLAEAYLRLGRLDDAMRAAEESIAICGTRQDLACIDGREIRAAVHLARKDRAAAIVDLETAVAMLEEARARLIPADFFKQQFGQMQTALFDFAIEMQLSEGKPREALETAERARSRAFLDLLASQDLAGPSAGRTGSDDESSLASERTAQPPTSADLTAIASRLGSTLVVYWVGATHVFIWTVQPDGKIEAATVHIPETTLATLVASVAPFGRAGAGFDRGSSSSWRRLHDLLIKPIRHALPRKPGALVTIVPHGPLSMLSFAALQDDRSRYLIEDYTLHYVPAAAILQFTPSRRQRASGSRDTLVIADPSLPKRSVLEQPLLGLPGARREARAIASGVPASRVTILEGTAASEGSVRANTTRKKVLHFATHAIVSDAEPLKSFLALASTGTGAAQDGILTAQEVYGLRLEADLVLLSACRSGGGRLTGDGMTTFARAFIYAGTPSLITSVWDVADESSSHLVPEFYRHWRNGASKASALRTAQLDFLKKLRAGTFSVETSAGPVLLPEHPALWAGFTLIGEPD